MKRGNKKNNLLKKIMPLIMAIAFCGGTFCIITPLLYFLSTYLLGFSISGLSLILTSGISSVMTLVIGLATKSIKIEEGYDINTEEDSLIMRSQLYVVNGKQDVREKKSIDEKPQLRSFNYSRYDNNYKDIDNREIVDDLMDMEFGTGYDDESRFQPKTRRRYKGKYL